MLAQKDRPDEPRYTLTPAGSAALREAEAPVPYRLSERAESEMEEEDDG